MKNKLVVWGTNAENEKVLIALELQPETNKVILYTFPESIASEEFVNKMMSEWRNGNPLPFPEGYGTLERELSVVESLLPDDLKVERGDLIQRAQTEWQFAVLSSKLHLAYKQELAEFREKVQALRAYDHSLWESLRAFWDKVQSQSRDRNLFREHADHLRDNINALFDDLKKLRSKVQDEFVSSSQKLYDEFNTLLDDVDKRIAAGGNKLNSVFEDLKQLQRRYRDARMSNEHRNTLWERLDGAFKAAKERKFGPSANEGSLAERHARRLEGLNEAIRRMEDSIKRDDDELTFQRRKIDASEGQLEAQIRTAKIKMIEERIASKREKLNEMNQTRADVERQIQSAKDKESRRSEKEQERQRLDAAREAAKNEIAANMRTQKPGAEKPADNYEAATLSAADDAPETPETEEKSAAESLLGAIGTIVGEAVEDAVTTAKAIAGVVRERGDDVLEELGEKAQSIYEQAMEKAGDIVEGFANPKNGNADTPPPAEEAAEAVTEAVAAETEPALSDEGTANQPADVEDEVKKDA